MSDPRRQPIGSWQAIDTYWDEINGDIDMDATESAHNTEVSLERGNTDGPELTARFEGYDAEGLACYSNVVI